MLGFPEITEIRRPIPKEEFFKYFEISGKVKQRFNEEIHSIIVRNIISPENTNIDRGKEVSAIYVIELQADAPEINDKELLLLNRMGHKAIYAETYGQNCRLAVYEGIIFKTEWHNINDFSIPIKGPDTDSAWAEIVRSIGHLPRDMPLNVAIEREAHDREIRSQIDALEKKLVNEKQHHCKREIYQEIVKLKSQLYNNI